MGATPARRQPACREERTAGWLHTRTTAHLRNEATPFQWHCLTLGFDGTALAVFGLLGGLCAAPPYATPASADSPTLPLTLQLPPGQGPVEQVIRHGADRLPAVAGQEEQPVVDVVRQVEVPRPGLAGRGRPLPLGGGARRAHWTRPLLRRLLGLDVIRRRGPGVGRIGRRGRPQQPAGSLSCSVA